jgi:two-component system cell cycle sensor histidine kinase/response regulator CckA
LIARLRTLRPNTKVLLMSGYSEYSGGPQGPVPSQTLILQKPFSLRALVEKVRDVLAGKLDPASERHQGVLD